MNGEGFEERGTGGGPATYLPRAPKKDQIWQRQNVERESARLRRQLESRIEAEGLQAAVAAAERDTDRLSRRSDYASQLKTYLYCTELLRVHRDRGTLLSEERIDELFRLGGSILEDQGIKPTTSRLAGLHGELHWLKSDLFLDRDENWSATWERLIGYYKSHRESELVLPPESLLGDPDALASLRLDTDSDDALVAIRSLRLRGEPTRARERLSAELRADGVDDERRLALEWEAACLDAAATASLAPMARLVRRGLAHHRAPWLLEFTLWSKISKSKEWLERVPRVRSIRRLAAGDTVEEDGFFRGAATLERCYQNEILFSARLEALGNCLREAEQLRSAERLLLLWAAAGRWLVRAKQEALARAVVAKYRALSRYFSEGRTGDALGLMEDIAVSGSAELPWEDFVVDTRRPPPSSKWQRLGEFSKMSAEMAWAGGKHWLQSGQDAASDQAYLAVIDVAVRYMSRLKGPFMKLGQWASYSSFGITDEAAAILSTLQDRAEPVAPELVRETVTRELQKPLRQLFSDWDDRPLATGSVGQVHRARTREGRDVVVKVQYPRIDEVMANDLFCVSLLKPFLKRILPHWEFADLFRELRARMADECDYHKEARHQIRFRENFAAHADIWIPEVIETHSGRRVLTSELVPGVKIAELARTGTLEERSRAAETIVRSHWESVFRYRYFNSDPHPGNFLICGDRVAILDFGSVKEWSQDACWGLREITTSYLENDVGMYLSGMLRAGLVGAESSFDAQGMFERLRDTLVGVVQHDHEVELTREMALDYVRRCTLKNPDFYRSVHVTDECLLLFRAHWGLFGTLGLLRPRLNWRRVFLAAVRDLEAIPPLSDKLRYVN